jgi:hypothetical protein
MKTFNMRVIVVRLWQQNLAIYLIDEQNYLYSSSNIKRVNKVYSVTRLLRSKSVRKIYEEHIQIIRKVKVKIFP